MARRTKATAVSTLGAYAAMKAEEARQARLLELAAIPQTDDGPPAPIVEQVERVRASAQSLADALKSASRFIPVMRTELEPLGKLVLSGLVNGVYELDHWPEMIALLAPALAEIARIVPEAVKLAPPPPRGRGLSLAGPPLVSVPVPVGSKLTMLVDAEEAQRVYGYPWGDAVRSVQVENEYVRVYVVEPKREDGEK